MKDSSKIWVDYAIENLASAKLLLESNLYNPCLQNIQQVGEKALKALLIELSLPLRKTHKIVELNNLLNDAGFTIDISAEECEFLDTIYIPSKYPLSSALPDYDPGVDTCKWAIQIAEKVLESVKLHLDNH